ncbi:alkaline phosphatase family protein [Chitinophagaceae bacterium LWZ2-11]
MRKIYSLLLATVLVVSSASAQRAKHVVIISIDGFRPDFYKDDSWGAVNLRQLMNTGAYSDGVRGIFPTVTYPSHTTIMTGVSPLKHGIYYNTPFEPNGATGRWYWEYDSVKVPSLWTIAKQANLTTAGVWWPVTVGAPITYNFPEVWALPRTNVKANMDILSNSANPKGLFEEIQSNATGKLQLDDLSSDYLSHDENNARISAYLIRTYKPALLAVHLPCTDHFEHEEGRDGIKVRQAVAGADRAVKTILEAIERAGIKDSTTVFIVGDHGFVDIHTSIAPNVWLAKAGLINNVKTGDWKAMFHQSGGSAFLHLKNKNDDKTLKQVKDLLASLPESQKKLFRVVERKELDAIGSDPNAVLALAPVQGIAVSAAITGEVLKSVKGGTHGFFPDFKEIQTGFIASGAGIQKGSVIPVMGLEDIAPLAAKLLGLEMPTADGTLYTGLLSKESK